MGIGFERWEGGKLHSGGGGGGVSGAKWVEEGRVRRLFPFTSWLIEPFDCRVFTVFSHVFVTFAIVESHGVGGKRMVKRSLYFLHPPPPCTNSCHNIYFF